MCTYTQSLWKRENVTKQYITNGKRMKTQMASMHDPHYTCQRGALKLYMCEPRIFRYTIAYTGAKACKCHQNGDVLRMQKRMKAQVAAWQE